MKQTLLSVAAASALMAISTGAFAADIVRQDSFDGSLYYNDQINGLKGGTFLAEGSWRNIILADDKDKDYTISGFSRFIINNKNTITDNSVNGLQAANGSTLKLLNMGTISIYESGFRVTSGNSPIPIHAYGGHIVIDASGDIELKSEVSNGLMVQATEKGKQASAIIKTAGNFTVESSAAAVLAGLLQKEIQSSRVEVQAKNISIQSLKNDGIVIYDLDKTWNPDDPKAGSASVNLNAEEDLSISA